MEVRPTSSMSLLCTVERTIQSYKAEEAKLNGSIQFYRELLHNLTLQPSEEADLGDDEAAAAADPDNAQREKEDIELLERVLEKALIVRTSSEPSRRDAHSTNFSGTQKKKHTTMDVLHFPTVSKGNQKTLKSISETTSVDKKGFKLSGLSACSTLSSKHSTNHKPRESKTRIHNSSSSSAQAVRHQESKKLQQAVSASASPDQITSSLSKNKTAKHNVERNNDPNKAASAFALSSNDNVPFSRTHDSEANNVLHRRGLDRLLSEQTTKWKSLRSKQSRLWEKVTALQRKPEPGRSHFMERMRAMFPKDWPRGSPDQTRALLDRLTHKGLNLAHRCQSEVFLAEQKSEMTTKLGGKDIKNDSCLILEKLQLASAELQFFAAQVKQEWKAWDRWRPEGGCLCPAGANDVLGDEITSPLPLTVTYRTEAELQELERLRMRVSLLEQEVYLEQVLLDTLSPQLVSIAPGPTCPSPTVLRAIYSLLGEGGERFPAIVLDAECE